MGRWGLGSGVCICVGGAHVCMGTCANVLDHASVGASLSLGVYLWVGVGLPLVHVLECGCQDMWQ